MRTLPLPLRNRLAEVVIAAVEDDRARRTLSEVAERPERWLGADETQWAPLLAARARRASEALADAPPLRRDDVEAALAAARRLFDAGLFFEVHEVLEPLWAAASGETRDTLQGVIQAAVGWQHLANGNVAGARALLTDGAARLHRRSLAGVDFDAFARAAAEAAARLPVTVDPPRFPRERATT
jgi:predicted metal-dependent hydrolase